MNFRLSSGGETVYFKNPDGSRVLDVARFGGQENGIASGRWPDGANDWYRSGGQDPWDQQRRRPGFPNLVINELMYNPLSGDDDDQYVEIYNRGAAATLTSAGWDPERWHLRSIFPAIPF